MKFATYGRKSVYSDNSDSVDNPERMCREYADFRFKDQAAEIARFMQGLDGFSDVEKNKIVQEVVQECKWDGNMLVLRLSVHVW